MSRKRLTVVQVLPSLDGGGVELGTVELSQELARRGHRSIVISGGGKLVEQIEADGGEHVCWPIGKKSPATLLWARQLKKLLRREKVDILHARSRIPAWVCWVALKTMIFGRKPRFVTTAHGLYSVNRYSEIMTSGERVIAISETVEHYLRESYPRLNPQRIRLIPEGIDEEQFPRGFQPSSRWIDKWYAEYPQLMGKPVIALVGRITRCKGHDDFIEIVDQLRLCCPDIIGLIVGGEDPRRRSYADEIRRLVEQRGLQEHIVFTGHRRDVAEIFSSCNVVLSLTSDPPEAFGRTTAEALSLGIPVVGYDHGGTGEILRKAFPEGLVPSGNVAAAAQQVGRILAEGASVPSDHPYLKDRMLRQTLSLYEELAA
ncbi:glycosyltransferase family 4 protein [Planctomicrobium sp. SH664]|uniref:glycosyltransferase family 4 protein n=1 Tax=Planctomicrobium sp. SH664 TaxID=3448125 RepID=UPI003F5C03F9